MLAYKVARGDDNRGIIERHNRALLVVLIIGDVEES